MERHFFFRMSQSLQLLSLYMRIASLPKKGCSYDAQPQRRIYWGTKEWQRNVDKEDLSFLHKIVLIAYR